MSKVKINLRVPVHRNDCVYVFVPYIPYAYRIPSNQLTELNTDMKAAIKKDVDE